MKTAIVILNWNTEGFLKRFLPGLLHSVQDEDAEVIVADNASTDGSIAMMKEFFPHVRTITSEKNLGFTGGYNRAFDIIVPEKADKKADKEADGIENEREIAEVSGKPAKEATACRKADEAPEYFVLINSDIEVTPGWLRPLTDWMDSHSECGACAPKLHSLQEREMFEYAGAAGGWLDKYGYPFCRGRVMKRLERDCGQYDTPENVFWATGACIMVRSSLYRKLGGLDGRFFAHMEEIDLCWRMQLEGHKVTVVPQSLVYHVGGGTLPQTSPFKLFLNYRNNLLMLSNNLGKTFALGLYRKGMDTTKAAQKGLRMARHRIFVRMILDGLSSAAYLASFKRECFKAVWKAHGEYRSKRNSPDVAQIRDYLERHGKAASVEGWYSRWIIPQAMLRGKDIFRSIRKEDFYKG